MYRKLYAVKQTAKKHLLPLAVLVAFLLATVLAAIPNKHSAADQLNTTQIPTPTANSSPQFPIIGPDNNIWFAESSTPNIARMTTGGTITEFPLPGTFEPFEVFSGPDGNIWFIALDTSNSQNTIGKITTTGVVTMYTMPTPSPNDMFLLVNGPDGNVWFQEADNAIVGKITTSGTVTEYHLPSPTSQPTSLAVGADNNIWITEQGAHMIGRMTTSGTLTEFAMPSSPVSASELTMGSDGNLWFEQQFPTAVDKVTTAGVISEYDVPAAPNSIFITRGPDGNIWFAAPDVHEVGKVTPSGTLTEYPTGSSFVDPTLITTGPDNNLWFTDVTYGGVGRVTTAGTITTFSAGTPRPSDIITGPDGNLYFLDSSWSRAVRADMLPVVSSVTPRPATYGAWIGVQGQNMAGTAGVLLGGTAVTQTPCPAAPVSPCYDIVSGTEVIVRTTAPLTSATTVQINNTWGQGAPAAVGALSYGIASAGTFSPHVIDPGGRNPQHVSMGSDGNLWAVVSSPDAVVRMTPSGQVTEFALAGPGYGGVEGPDGNYWVGEGTLDTIRRITPTGTATDFTVTAGSFPTAITVGPDGNLWFGEDNAAKVGVMDTSGTVLAEYPVGATTFAIDDITTGPDNNLWVTIGNASGGAVGRLTTTGTYTEYAVPGSGYVYGIAAGPDGNVWVADSTSNKIHRVTTAGAFTSFDVPTVNASPDGLVRGPDGNLWFSEDNANQVGKITTAGAITEYGFSASNDYAFDFTASSTGIWFTTSDSIDQLTFGSSGSGGGSGGSGNNAGSGSGSNSSPGTPTTGKSSSGQGGSTTAATSATDTPTTPPPTNSSVDLLQFPEFTNGTGYQTPVMPGDKFTFTPDGKPSKDSYAITVGTIDASGVDLTITPPNGTPQQVVLPPNQPTNVDVTNDRAPDLTLKATHLTLDRATITFALYRAKLSSPATATRSVWLSIALHLPHLVLAGFPYLLFLLLLVIMALTLRIIRREIAAARRLQQLYRLQASLAEQKDVFIELASHYLRTPLTIIRGALELAGAHGNGPPPAMAAMHAADQIGQRVEMLLSGILAQLPRAGAEPAAPKANPLRILAQPLFYLPVALLLMVIAVMYKLAVAVLSGGLVRTNTAVQLASAALFAVGLYALVRSRQLHQQERRRLADAVAAQASLDAQRNRLIAEAAEALRRQAADLRRDITALPEGDGRRMAEEGAGQFAKLIDQFVVARELQAVPEPPLPERTTTAEIFAYAASVVEQQAAKRRISVSEPAIAELTIRSPQMLGLVLRSLVDNAVAYSNDGSVVEVRYQPGGTGRFIVTDHGKGMPADFAAQWFKPFSKEEGALTFNHEGAGFSLYLDHLIMTYLGGTISLESAPGRGTTATLVFPAE